jgi:hypothetical protein
MVSCRFLPSTNPMKLTAGDIWPALWGATLWQSSLWNHGENGMMTGLVPMAMSNHHV